MMSRRAALRLLIPVSLLATLLPERAVAHLPTLGLGPVYDGLFHFVLSPDDLLPVIALALLCGQRGAGFGRRALWLLPLSWLAGGVAGMFIGWAPGAPLTALSLLVLGVLVAMHARVSLRTASLLAVWLGVVHGYLNGAGINRYDGGMPAVMGLACGVFIAAALFAALVVPLRRPWTLVAVRVAGSWIAATGLLMAGWALRGSV